MRTVRALVATAAVALLSLLTGCVADETPPRRAPDQVETAAVFVAQATAQRDGIPINSGSWVQLWTPNQAGPAIRDCIVRASGGAVTYTPDPVARHLDGYPGGTVGVNADSPPAVDFTSAAMLVLVDSCLATVPVDVRIMQVPPRDRAALYAYDLTVLRRCLLEHGQTVAKMPSRERFENLLRASAPWSAYDDVIVPTRAAWYALTDACPAFPNTIAGDIAALTTAATTP
jgi:hypothetical protein